MNRNLMNTKKIIVSYLPEDRPIINRISHMFKLLTVSILNNEIIFLIILFKPDARKKQVSLKVFKENCNQEDVERTVD